MCPIFDDFLVSWKREARLDSGDGWKLCQDKVIELHILPHLTGKQLIDITPSDISRVIEASKLKKHAPNQTKKIYMVVSKIFNDAVEFYDLIDRSPVRKKFHKPKTILIEQPAMSWEQSVILLEYVMHHPIYALPIWIQTLSGPRTSEIEALEWPEVHFEEDYIWLNKAYNRTTKIIQPFTKNKSHYAVPLPKKLSNFLQKFRKKSGLVCPGSDGKMLNRWAYQYYFTSVRKRLNLQITSPHGLRHSCSKIYKDAGATDEQIKVLLGHKTIISTKTYLHGHRTGELLPLIELSKKFA